MTEININKQYELYQIITDFGDPLEIFREAFQNAVDENSSKVYCRVFLEKKLGMEDLIIDIWNNGQGLSREKAHCFFDLANSTKVNSDYVPQKEKLGYKGHGSKIFFNSRKVIIASKSDTDEWSIEMMEPLIQLQKNGKLEYSEFIEKHKMEVKLPDEWNQGFYVRIIEHLHFRNKSTRFKLNHKSIRDYAKWFTVFGSIKPLFDEDLKNKNIKLYLQGLDIDSFKNEFDKKELIDPVPIFITTNGIIYEEIELGHYFPDERYNDKDMKNYSQRINSNRPYYEFYSRKIYYNKVNTSSGKSFNLIISIEGYETKRRYDILLTKRGKPRTDITHTDSERYGIWACKGGIPIEKIDEWIEGTKGIYTFMQVFVDCDDFELTANRGTIHNSDIEILSIIKKELNDIFDKSNIKKYINERLEYENLEKIITSVKDDGENLKFRFKNSSGRKEILLPGGTKLLAPSEKKSGYSESETLVLLVQLITLYPNFLNFNIRDYDTYKGIDFVVEDNYGNPKYIELKGTFYNKINHPFQYTYKFICYELKIKPNEYVYDIEGVKAKLENNSNDKFKSNDDNFNGKIYESFKLNPDSAAYQSMEIIELKSFLTTILDAKIT